MNAASASDRQPVSNALTLGVLSAVVLVVVAIISIVIIRPSAGGVSD